jgi:endonuclease/exonuclease/phosphatase family metal-dependent hydrolase
MRVMSFNIWVGGDAGKLPLTQTLKVIEAAKADAVGLQEKMGNRANGARPDQGKKLAEMLGWHYFDQDPGQSTAVLSRYPIVTNSAGKWGVKVRLPSGKETWVFNVHLAHAPYQPYQLLKIPYADAPFISSAEEAVTEAKKARGGQVERLLVDLKPAVASGLPVFVTGDFNEPSHLDWTERAAKAGKAPRAVKYPTTLAVIGAGLRDAFRTKFPDEVERPGWTWTPLTRPDDPKDRHDRIDFVLFGGTEMKVMDCQIIGEAKPAADVVVEPYPSDHRAVVATFEIP